MNTVKNTKKSLPALKVRKTFAEQGDFVSVSIDTESFRLITGARPALPYETYGSEDGLGIRAFKFSNATLYSNLEKYTDEYGEQRTRNRFFVTVADAKKALMPIERERANGPKLAINLGDFEYLD